MRGPTATKSSTGVKGTFSPKTAGPDTAGASGVRRRSGTTHTAQSIDARTPHAPRQDPFTAYIRLSARCMRLRRSSTPSPGNDATPTLTVMRTVRPAIS